MAPTTGRRRRWRVAVAMILALLAAGAGTLAGAASPPAGASPLPAACSQGGGVSIFGLSNVRHAVAIELPVCATGGIAVSLHSTAAACATGGPCGYDGTESATSVPSGQIVLIGVRGRGGLRIIGGSLFGGAPSAVRSAVTRRRAHGAAAACRDQASGFGGQFTVRPHGGLVTVSLAAGDGQPLASALLGSQCAGPTDRDIGAALPRITLPLATVIGGHAMIDLSGTHAYASRDFTGTVSSTLVLATGRATVSPIQSGTTGRGIRHRNLIERYRVVRLRGRLAVTITGSRNARRCGPLDACGARERATLAVRGRPGGSIFLNADGLARRPAADFLAALGRGSGDTGGIAVQGGGQLDVAGTVAERLRTPTRCADEQHFAATSLTLSPRAGEMQVELRGAFAGSDPLRTRCPGPALGLRVLARTSVPLRAFAPRVTTLALRGRRFTVGPYTLDPAGAITVELRRRSTSVQLYRAPR